MADWTGAVGEPERFSSAAGPRASSWLWRFVAGQVLTRAPGPLDAEWLAWAPDPATTGSLSAGLAAPRSRWARRPGLHRQLARLAALLTAAAFALAPALTLAAVMGAALACVAVLVGRSGAATSSPEWAITSTPEPAGAATRRREALSLRAESAGRGSQGENVDSPLTSRDMVATEHNNTRSREHGMR